MPQLPDRHGRVGRVLIDVAVAVQRRLDIGGVERMLRRETVEAAAPHEEEKVDQHIAFGAQLALVSGLTQDARARKARSEERRVGEECGSTFRSRGYAAH